MSSLTLRFARCATAVPGNAGFFCPTCVTALTTDPHKTCPRCCSEIGEFTQIVKGCPRCRDERFQFERSFRLGSYDGLLRDAILRMKNAGGEILAECLGQLWAESAETRLREVGANVVIPIALHWRRKWQRGYNQAEALAEAIARRLEVHYAPGWLKRVRPTAHQAELSGTERRENLRKAFRAGRRSCLKDKIVLLVDDVLTTGTTASEAARALREAGATRVVVAVLAHR